MRFLSLILLLPALATQVVAKVSYAGAKAVRVPIGADTEALKTFINGRNLQTWKNAKAGEVTPNSLVDFVVPKSVVSEFEKKAEEEGWNVEVLHEDLGKDIEEEGKVGVYAANSAYFNAYHPYTEHIQFLNDLQAANPSRSEIVVAGNSNQGRPITGIHFWGSGGKGSKSAIVLHGTVHAREWISGMTTEFLAWTLLSNYTTSPEIKSFVDKYDFYIFPVVNPDGFIYTQTTNRLWRKNRQTVSSSSCVGRDINRNWPYQWQVTGGASTNPCDETYKGAAAGDATETRVLRTYLDNLAAGKGITLYLDIHAYSQLLLSPYGYSCSVTARDNTKIQQLAAGFATAIRNVYGTRYTYGPICQTLYKATGSSVDYAFDVNRAKYAYTVELRDTGRYGFVLPPAQIWPTGVETWAGVRSLLINM